MAQEDADAPTNGAERRVLRGPSGEASVVGHLRLVYDRDADERLPQEFRDLLAQLD